MATATRPDDISDFQRVVDAVNSFNKTRGWNPLSSDIAKSVVIEAAELLEKYQWDETDKEHKSPLISLKNKEELGEEVADVFWYLITYCKREEIDLLSVLRDKIKKNEKKYPAGKFRGKNNQKFYISQKKKYRENRKKRI